METITIFIEEFAHIMLGLAEDGPLPPSKKNFYIELKDPSEKSVIVEMNEEVRQFIEHRGDAECAETDLRLIEVPHPLVEVMNKLAAELVLQNIKPTFISTFDWDYILIPADNLSDFEEIAKKHYQIEHKSIVNFWEKR
jgi:hypothetical protein